MMVLSTLRLVGMVAWLSGVFSGKGVARSADAEVADLSEGQRATHTGKEPEGPGDGKAQAVDNQFTAVDGRSTSAESSAEYPRGTQLIEGVKRSGGHGQPQHNTAEPEGPGSSESPKVGMRLTAVNSKPTGEELLAEYPRGTQALRMEQCGECLGHQPQDVSSSEESEEKEQENTTSSPPSTNSLLGLNTSLGGVAPGGESMSMETLIDSASPPVHTQVHAAVPPASIKKGPKKGIPGLKGWHKCQGQASLKPQEVVMKRRAEMKSKLGDLRVWSLAFTQVMGRRPRAIDLFSGEGGMAHGLALAGFEVRARELVARPYHTRHPRVTLEMGDALEADLSWADVVFASPPCQSYTTLTKAGGGRQSRRSCA